MEEAGVKLIAQGNAAYIGDMKNATSATNTFVDATDKGAGKVSAAGQVMIGGLRKVGEFVVDSFAQATQATAVFLKGSVDLAGDFQAGMNEFQVAAGKDIDTAGLEKFHDLFLQLGKDLPVSTSDVQQAAIELVKGGIDPATVAAGGLKQAIQFASAAMKGDLVGAAEISSKIVAGWADVNATAADKADLLTHATDLFTKAANASSTNVQQLSQGIFNAQGIAKTAGVSLDDLTTTIAELSGDFSSSAEAGTSLKNMIARLQPTTKPAIAAMEGLGLFTDEAGSAFYDAAGNFVGFQQASELLQNSLAGLTKEQQAQALQTIFGNDAMAAAAGLAARGGEGYAAMAADLKNAMGVAEAGATIQDGYNIAIENAKGSVEAFQIQLGEHLLPILTTLFNDYITPGINTLSEFTDTFFKMVPAIQASDDPLQTFLNALKIAAPGLLDVISGVERIKDAIAPAVNEIMRLADAFGQGGLGGLIDAVVSDISAALPDIEAALLGWGQAFVDWIAPMIPTLLDKMGALADDAWDWVKAQAPEWGKQLLTWGNELVEWIAPMIPPALAELGKMGNQFLGWIGAQAQPLLTKFNDWAASLVEWIVPATVTFLAEWPKMFDQFLDWVGNAAGPLLKQLGDWALSFIQWVAPMIPPFLVALGGVALAIGVWVVETAAVLAGKIINKWVPAIIGWIVTDAIPGLYKALESIWQVFQSWILDIERDLAMKMREVGKSIIDGIKTGISNAWGSMVGWLSSKMSSLVDAAMDAIGAGSPAKEFMPVGEFSVTGIMQGFSDTWPHLTALVSSLSDDLIEQVADIGQQVQGMIADSFGATASIDRQLAKNMDAFKDVLPDYQQYTAGALKQVESEARAFLDPAEGAKYFQMRSKQILEYAKLQKDLSEAQNADDKARIQKQMSLIASAHRAEISQFDANKAANGSPLQDLIGQIQQLFNNDKKAALEEQYAKAKTDAERERIRKEIEAAAIPVNDTGIGHDLQALIALLTQIFNAPHRAGGGTMESGQPYWIGEHGPELFWPQMSGMVSPAASSQQMAARANTTNYNTTYNNTMPMYTNNSPGALQQSWAIMQASMP